MADLDLWIIGDPGGAVGGLAATFGTIGRQDYIRVNDLDQMVTVILQRLGPSNRIRSLQITDHGDSWDAGGTAVGPSKLAHGGVPL